MILQQKYDPTLQQAMAHGHGVWKNEEWRRFTSYRPHKVSEISQQIERTKCHPDPSPV